MRVFIDGREGTTGLRIESRLAARRECRIITLPDALRKDANARRDALNACDAAFLCLPDAAATQAVSMIENPNVRVLDTSTAHRVDPAFVYGFPERSAAQRAQIASARRVAVPGCHATGYIALVAPLVDEGLLSPDALLCAHSLTGYSGGGKKMIADYESAERSPLLDAPRAYGLAQAHKHLPEMTHYTNTNNSPVFCPIVSDFYSGMLVTVPLFRAQLQKGFTRSDVVDCLRARYAGPVVAYADCPDEAGFLSAGARAGRDDLQVCVLGGDERMLLTARYDNLGKGASGAAVQCLNLMFGLPETTGLTL